MVQSTRVARPAGVTVVVVLAVIAGLLDILAGLGLILARDDVSVQTDGGLSSTGVLVSGIFAIAVGLFVILVARALSWGSSPARWLVVLVMVLRLIAGVAGVIAYAGVQRWGYAAQIVLSVVIVALLFTSSASAFFHARKYS